MSQLITSDKYKGLNLATTTYGKVKILRTEVDPVGGEVPVLLNIAGSMELAKRWIDNAIKRGAIQYVEEPSHDVEDLDQVAEEPSQDVEEPN